MKIRMELTEALVTEDITPFERERLREALEDEVRRQLPTDRQLLRVVDWDPGGGHAVENTPGIGLPLESWRLLYAAAGWSAASLSYWIGDINAAELCRRRWL